MLNDGGAATHMNEVTREGAIVEPPKDAERAIPAIAIVGWWRTPAKRLMKGAARFIAQAFVLPAFALFLVGSFVLGKDQVFPGWSQAFSLLPGLTGVYLRAAFYGFALDQCGPDARITFGSVFSHSAARVGRNVYVGAFCCFGNITLENDVLVGSHVSIANGARQHGIDRLDLPVREQPGSWPRVTIGEDSWIGERAVVMADVGRHCVVAAGAVVVDAAPDYAIVGGVPARVLGDRRRGPNGAKV